MSTTHVTATSRAARMIAGAASGLGPEDTLTPLREAQADGHVVELVLALAVRCAQLAADLYGDRAQAEMDAFAFDALSYQEGQRGRY